MEESKCRKCRFIQMFSSNSYAKETPEDMGIHTMEEITQAAVARYLTK